MGHLKEIKVPKRSPRKVGVVESDRLDKTRRVAIHFTVKHPKYGKYIRWRTRIQVHDAENTSHVGDTVEIAECRPISKQKSWVLVRVIERAQESVELPAAEPGEEAGDPQ